MKAFSKIVFFFCVVFGCPLFLSQITISGKVIYKKKGVEGISITLKNTYDGATSDKNGNFSFETSEKGKQTLVFSNDEYVESEKEITIENTPISVLMEMKEQIREIQAVVISVGAIEASDKKRATALLSPTDIYTTAGANGQISSALNFLPGVQKVGETEGLFVRGGTGSETKIFMDGSLVNNYFSNSVPGIAGRDRFNTSLFKGNIFSSGGYSALYGQALSGALMLESVDLPEQSSYDLGISPIFANVGMQKLQAEKNRSFGASLGYSNLNLMQKVLKFNTQFSPAPEGINADANFRIKTKQGGILKYYGMYSTNTIGVKTPSLEPETDFSVMKLNGKNSFHALSFRQKMGKYGLNSSFSYTYNVNDLAFSTEKNALESGSSVINNMGNYFNAKAVIDRKINKISALRGGLELNTTNENLDFSVGNKIYKDKITSAFAETDMGFSNSFSVKLGVRTEYSSFLGKTNFAPRFAMAYKINPHWTSSFAYGWFYQTPESRYINGNFGLNFQKSEHSILQLIRSTEGQSLRFEAFYKTYNQLIKTQNFIPNLATNQQIPTAINNNGSGYAKGLEVFWRDKVSIKNVDYWVSYSYLDTKRDFMNYPMLLKPNFASEHTLALVAKKFVTQWKTGFNLSYNYAKGRPFYDIISQNNQNNIRNEGRLKDYSALNFSINYLPNLGKKDSKAFTVLVLSVSNVLGSQNVYGYQFSQDGMRNAAIVPPINTFVFVGIFISFGVDKSQNAINNNL